MSFFGANVPSILEKGGLVDSSSLLAGKKYVLIYFSAHWCPPCRRFTPQLAEFYTTLKQERNDFELVFVSSDRSKEQFDEYFAEMPWPAVPFDNRAAATKWNKKMQVEGIPTLVILDAESGKLINKDAADVIREDGIAGAVKSFPWKKRSLREILETANISDKAGNKITTADLAQLRDGFALYFSAHWCPPCRGFTPTLVNTYEAMKKNGKAQFEFIFISSDRSDAEFAEYYSTMPWASLAREDPAKPELAALCGVEGIPMLVTISNTFEIISTKARTVVNSDPEGLEYPWPAKPLPLVAELSMEESRVDALNENVCFLLLNGSDSQKSVFADAARKFEEARLKSVADADDAVSATFFIVGAEGADLFTRILQVVGSDDVPQSSSEAYVLALRLGSEKHKTVTTDVSQNGIADFAIQFYAKATAE